MSALVESAHAHCRALTQARAGNFYHGLKLLGPEQRQAMFAVYAWMRHADDIADRVYGEGATLTAESLQESSGDAEALLRDLGRRTAEVLGGAPPGDDAVFIALADVQRRCGLPAEDFLAMIEGQIDDLRFVQPSDFAALERYCMRVASSVGRLCVRIWGRSDDAALQLANRRGIAFQLTNILRDLKEDHAAGRMYLPASEMAHAGLTATELLSWEEGSRCAEFILAQVQRARGYYDSSAALESMLAPRPRAALRAMTRIYEGILSQIGRRPFRVVSVPRIALSTPQKWMIALRARLAVGV